MLQFIANFLRKRIVGCGFEPETKRVWIYGKNWFLSWPPRETVLSPRQRASTIAHALLETRQSASDGTTACARQPVAQ
jgi:hypothetical protein